MDPRPQALLIEPCNFRDFPAGGQLSSARQFMRVFGDRLALVGVTTGSEPVGRWIEEDFDGKRFLIFNVARWKPSSKRPLVPRRLSAFVGFWYHRKHIFSLGVRNAFIREHEALMALSGMPWESVCYYFPGLENPLRISRYVWAKPLVRLFQSHFAHALRSADLLLAAADSASIAAYVARSECGLEENDITSFPTRVDTSVFQPSDKTWARGRLSLPSNACIVVTVGRLHWAKGWGLLVEAFKLLRTQRDDACLVLVGDGEDRPKIEKRITEDNLSEYVRITGYVDAATVATYLNAADLFVLGSHVEGWPTVVVEALATGKSVVSTPVSAARELVDNGKNGYVVESRDPHAFCDAMVAALQLNDVRAYSMAKAERCALAGLQDDIGRLWPPLGNRP